MDRITVEDLKALLSPGPEPRVSLYVTQQAGYPASEGNAQQLRHALFQAEAMLKAGGFDTALVTSLLRPGLDLVRGGDLWKAQGSKGLALLLAPGSCRYWQLPFACESTVDVGSEFCITPLVRLLNWPLDVRVVALSPNSVRLLQCTRDAIHELKLPPGTPPCLDQFEWGPDLGRAVRFQTSAGATGSTSVVHGQTSYKDEEETRLHAYVRSVALHIGESVKQDKRPLVLVAVKELHPVFKDAYIAQGMLDEGIHTSPAHLSDAELQEQVVRSIDAQGYGELKVARDRYRSAVETHHAASEIEDIVPAACAGQVDTLIVADRERAWGIWEKGSQRALVTGPTSQAPGVDLLELAVRETLRHGGRVCVVPRSEVPQQAQSVAALRWSAANRGVEPAVIRQGL